MTAYMLSFILVKGLGNPRDDHGTTAIAGYIVVCPQETQRRLGPAERAFEGHLQHQNGRFPAWNGHESLWNRE